MIRPMRIHHVSLVVTDLERAANFYETTLGLSRLERPPFDFPGIWYAVGDTGQQLHLLVHEGETLRTRGIDSRDGHFAMSVADFDETIRHLEQLHIPFDARPHSKAGFPQIYILDPDHNIIELNVTP